MVPTLRREVAIHGADDKFAVKRYFNRSGSSWDLLCNSVLQTRFSNSLNKNWTPEMLQGSIVFSLHCAVFSSTCHKQGSHKEVAQNSILFCCTPCLSPRPSLVHLRVYFIWAGTACSISEYFIGMGLLVELWLSGSIHISCQCVNDHFWWVSHFDTSCLYLLFLSMQTDCFISQSMQLINSKR